MGWAGPQKKAHDQVFRTETAGGKTCTLEGNGEAATGLRGGGKRELEKRETRSFSIIKRDLKRHRGVNEKVGRGERASSVSSRSAPPSRGIGGKDNVPGGGRGWSTHKSERTSSVPCTRASGKGIIDIASESKLNDTVEKRRIDGNRKGEWRLE